jgi:hypothetical protein
METIMLYRYKKITDEYTTHYAHSLIDDPTWLEHCTLDDGYTYVTCNGPVPKQNPIIEFELINPPAQFFTLVRNASVHMELMEKRVAAGKYMREDGHIVPGTSEEVAAWRQQMLDMFGIGG